MPTVPIYGKTHKTCSFSTNKTALKLNHSIYHRRLNVYQACSNDYRRLTFDLFTPRSNFALPYILYGENAEKTFSLYVLKTNGRNLQCMIKVVNPFCYNQDCVPCCWAIYWYEIMFHKISHGAFCRRDLDFFFNRSNSLNKFAAMPIYGKTPLKNLLL